MSRTDLDRRTILKTSSAGFGLALVAGHAEAKPHSLKSSSPAKSPFEREVSAAWQMRQVGSADWIAATVPGTVHTDLLAANKIPDPFYRTNERDQQWIDKVDWEYKTTLDIDSETFSKDHIELVFAGLDTYADAYINDTLCLAANNMFRQWTVDVKSHLKPGTNSLRILFRSPIVEGLKALDALGYNPPAPNDQSENGGLGDKRVSVFTRKAGYHYGWDWGPRFVTSGIWRPVTLRAWNAIRINDLQILQDSLSPSAAELTVRFEIDADRAGKAVIDVASPTDPAIVSRAEVTLAKGLNTFPLKVTIANPKLWWTNGLGDAFLYTLVGRVTTADATDSRSVSTGLRSLKIVQTPDADGTSFYVELNGVPVFMKGANYIPNDSFLPRVTHDIYDRVVRSAVDTHMNMLRVWGGGTYEEDYFYDQCDRNGILIWHDFMFACSMYPGDAAFLENVRQEAIENVRRLRNHPSIALWVGNNEMDSAWQNDVPEGGWGWKQKYTEAQRSEMWKGYQAVFLDILPKVVAEEDSQRFYWPSSPQAAWDAKGQIKHADLSQVKQSGDIHYWDVWWGQKPFSDYRSHIGRFMSEYGFQSFPEFRTVQAYAEPADYDIFSEVMKAHQRSSIGNGTIKNYMQRDYNVPADFQQFLYVGQVLQAEGIKVAMEAHRARMPYCMGSLFWQINDCWPVASWSSIDYFGRWKAQQYFARQAFDKLLVSPVLDGDQLSVTVVSDHLQKKTAKLDLVVMDFAGQIISQLNQPLTIEANSASIVFNKNIQALVKGKATESLLLQATLSSGDQLLASNILYFQPVKELALPRKPEIVSRVRGVDGGVAVAVTSSVLVKNLCLDFDGHDGVFSDNYFDLMPGKTTVVTFTPRDAAVTPKPEALTLRHMMSI